jgi:hypothetical protein
LPPARRSATRWSSSTRCNGSSVFQAGEYEDGAVENSTWSTGDWNGDTEFNSRDLVVAFTGGGYEQGPRPSSQAIPEPTFRLMPGIVFLWYARRLNLSRSPFRSWFAASRRCQPVEKSSETSIVQFDSYGCSVRDRQR